MLTENLIDDESKKDDSRTGTTGGASLSGDRIEVIKRHYELEQQQKRQIADLKAQYTHEVFVTKPHEPFCIFSDY